MKKKKHWRLIVLRWHRRVGLVLSVFLVWMLFTGVALNHSDDWSLAKSFIKNDNVLKWYGVQAAAPLNIGNYPLILTTEGLWLNQHNLGDCSKLLGVVFINSQYIVACEERIVLLSNEAEVIDQVDKLRGLETPIQAMAKHHNVIFFRALQGIYQLNTEDLTLSPVTKNVTFTWLTPTQASTNISFERLLLDAHSGRLFGEWGKYFVDFFAMVLFTLLISGWFLAKRRHRKPDSV